MMQGTSLRQIAIRPILALLVIVAVIALTLLTAPVARADADHTVQFPHSSHLHQW